MGGHSSKSKNSYKVSAVAPQTQTSPAPAAAPAAAVADPVATVAKVDDTSKAVTAASPPPVLVDSRVVPNWIIESQFVKILRENVPKFAKIRSFNVKPGLGSGENYSTLMLRVSIEAELTGEADDIKNCRL